MTDGAVPTLDEWAGGDAALSRLTEQFYQRVRTDDLLRRCLRQMLPDHPQHVAVWLAEVFGGPARYTARWGWGEAPRYRP